MKNNEKNLTGSDAENDIKTKSPLDDQAAGGADEIAAMTEEIDVIEATQNEKPDVIIEKKSRKNWFRSNRFRRGSMATVMTAVFIAIIVVINVLVSILTARFPSLNVDLTAQKMNTLSEEAVKAAETVENETEIIIIADEDLARSDRLLSGVQYSQVVNLAEKMKEVNSKIKVSFVDLDKNPEFSSQYDETFNAGQVMVRTDKHYKVLTAVGDLFTANQNQTTGAVEYYSMVDGALANAVGVVNLDKLPVMAVATGHEEFFSTNNRVAFDTVLKEQAFEIKEFNLLTEDVPEGVQVLLIPTPSTDYTAEEIEKLRAYLADETSAESKTILVTCHPQQSKLPNLAGFLEEWGVQVQEGVVVESNSSQYISTDPTSVLVNSGGDVLKDNSYPLLLSPASSPLTLLFSANEDVITNKLWVTSNDAYVTLSELEDNPDTQEQIVATLSTKNVTKHDESTTENVIVFGSTVAFLENYGNSTTFSNKAFITDLIGQVTGTTVDTLYIQQVQTNSYDVTASSGTITVMGLGVFTIAIPLCILIAGLVIFLRRRHL